MPSGIIAVHALHFETGWDPESSVTGSSVQTHDRIFRRLRTAPDGCCHCLHCLLGYEGCRIDSPRHEVFVSLIGS